MAGEEERACVARDKVMFVEVATCVVGGEMTFMEVRTSVVGGEMMLIEGLEDKASIASGVTHRLEMAAGWGELELDGLVASEISGSLPRLSLS